MNLNLTQSNETKKFLWWNFWVLNLFFDRWQVKNPWFNWKNLQNFLTTPHFFLHIPLGSRKTFSKLYKKIPDQNPCLNVYRILLLPSRALKTSVLKIFEKPLNFFESPWSISHSKKSLRKLVMIFNREKEASLTSDHVAILLSFVWQKSQSVSDRKSPRTAFIIGR